MDKLTSIINADNTFEETNKLESELVRLNEDYLAGHVAISKNTALMNYCKPTAAFLNMEQREGSYCNLIKLRFQCTDVITKTKADAEIIDPSKIRDEMKTFYPKILISRI